MKQFYMKPTFLSALALSIAFLSAPNAAKSDIDLNNEVYKDKKKDEKKKEKNNKGSNNSSATYDDGAGAAGAAAAIGAF